MGWLNQLLRRSSPSGKVRMKSTIRDEEQHAEREDGAQLDDDGVHPPVGVVQRNLHQRFSDAQVRGRADRQKLGQAFHNSQEMD